MIERLPVYLKRMKPDPAVSVRKVRIGRMPALVLSPKDRRKAGPGILWIHGGGYFLGMKEMVWMGRAPDLVRKYGAVVISPGYRLAWRKPYPAALIDCYRALLYLSRNTEALGVAPGQIIVGGESAGGGLAAAVCMLAKDRGEVRVAFQLPLYPMLSNLDTPSSADNHGRVWNTRKNHLGWKLYLREKARSPVSCYASPIWRKDCRGLPPAYSFVGTGEPFYDETREYIRRLKAAGVPAAVDIYPTDMHAFDMLRPDDALSRKAVRRFEEAFEYALAHYCRQSETGAVDAGATPMERNR